MKKILLSGLIGLSLAALAAVIWMHRDLPENLIGTSEHGPIVLLDRDGNELRRVPAAHGRPGRDTWISLAKINPIAISILIAAEDQYFFLHSGVDARSLVRSLWLNLRAGGLHYGGSTISMQLARLLVSQGKKRTLPRKAYEIGLALRIERTLSKRQIIENYLNRAYYGHGAYGISAAARVFFDRPANSLSVGEIAFVSVLPRGPSFYDPTRHFARTVKRRNTLLDMLAAHDGISDGALRRAKNQPIQLHVDDSRVAFEAPHFSDWLLASLPDPVRNRGGEVTTTLDLSLQQNLEGAALAYVDKMKKYGVQQAGVVILDARNAEVLAMVGSKSYDDNRNGQLNIATWRRHPGSSLKPFVYGLAIESGKNPASIADDVADADGYRYQLSHKKVRERGPVRYREALAGSYNLAAVHVLESIGVERLMQRLRRAGVGKLPGRASDYGLNLALGSTKVRLVDLAASYRTFVYGGRTSPVVSVLHTRGHDGKIWRSMAAPTVRVFSPQTSWLVMDMLSDPTARRPMFGDDLPTDLPYPIVAKTGTASGLADAVAVFATREYIVAAWSGRFDGKAVHNLYGMQGPGWLARQALLLASGGQDLTLPSRPSGIKNITICPISGMLPGPHCPHRKDDYALAGKTPTKICNWHRKDSNGRTRVHYPPHLHRWATRRH